MNKCELAFLLSHLKKAIYNLERVKAYGNDIVDDSIINNLKETLLYYQIKQKEIQNNEQ